MSPNDPKKGGKKLSRWTMPMLERRMRILTLKKQQLRPSVIIRTILADANIVASESTIKRDLRDVDKWLPELVRFDPEDYREVAAELLADLRETKRMLFNLFYSTENGSVKVGSAKEINKMTFGEFEVRQSMGQLPKVADKVELDAGGGPLIVGLYDADSPSWELVKKELEDKRKEKTENADL